MEHISKYAIGDRVWKASVVRQRQVRPCPDCKDTKIWTAISPAGHEYSFKCPRCVSAHQSDLDYSILTPSTGAHLTIGQVRVQSTYESGKLHIKAEYMCKETGVGSGTLHQECDLWPTEQEAYEAAKVMAEQQAMEDTTLTERYNKVLEISTWHLNGTRCFNALAKADWCPSPRLREAWELVREYLPANAGIYDDELTAKQKKAVNAFRVARSRLTKFFNRGTTSSGVHDDE